jgi:hypothetical protein
MTNYGKARVLCGICRNVNRARDMGIKLFIMVTVKRLNPFVLRQVTFSRDELVLYGTIVRNVSNDSQIVHSFNSDPRSGYFEIVNHESKLKQI